MKKNLMIVNIPHDIKSWRKAINFVGDTDTWDGTQIRACLEKYDEIHYDKEAGSYYSGVPNDYCEVIDFKDIGKEKTPTYTDLNGWDFDNQF